MGLKEGVKMGWRGTDRAYPVSGQRGWCVDGRGSMGRRGVDLGLSKGLECCFDYLRCVLRVRVRL